MPIYEYRCTSCGHDLEANQSFSDDPLTSCPECGGTLRKVFGSVGIVLKGSGFYRTDSRPSSARTSAGAKEPGNGSAPDAGATTKAEPSSNGSAAPKEAAPATTASAGAGSSGASGSTSSGAGSSGT